MIKKPVLYLTHILQAIRSIEKNLRGVTREQFGASELMEGFVERKLEIIGEATKNIPDAFKKQYPDIAWKDMAGMRDILIHQYIDVDEDIVWKTATERIPPLKKHIEKILQEETVKMG
jgi:uncharacterized protein with HEPN domain